MRLPKLRATSSGHRKCGQTELCSLPCNTNPISSQGHRSTPSWVAFDKSERHFGQRAISQSAKNSQITLFDVKRLIGRHFEDGKVMKDMEMLPFAVEKLDNKITIGAKVGGIEKHFFPEEVSAMVLEYMRSVAEAYVEHSVSKAVISVPACFNDSQRQATKAAAKIAGLEVLRIINEPTAAALAYRFNMDLSASKIILIYDFGGATFDSSIVEIGRNNLRVIGTYGDMNIGGNDIDRLLVEHFIDDFEEKHKKMGVRNNSKAVLKLRIEIEKKKRFLSMSKETDILIESFFDDIDFEATLTLEKLNELSQDIIRRTFHCVDECLTAANLTKDHINLVVPVGGSTRLAKVQELLLECFGHDKLAKDINADEAVAIGAAMEAAIISGTANNYSIEDVTPMSLVVESSNLMSFIMPRNSPLQRSLNVQCFVVGSEQHFGRLNVYQGERLEPSKNHFIGKLLFCDLRGSQPVGISFILDKDGILTVAGTNPITGVESKFQFPKSRLTQPKIEELAKNAEKLRNEMRTKERDTSLTRLRVYYSNLKTTLDENEHNFIAPEKEKLRNALREVQNILTRDERDEIPHGWIKTMHKEIEKICLPIINKMYDRVQENIEKETALKRKQAQQREEARLWELAREKGQARERERKHEQPREQGRQRDLEQERQRIEEQTRPVSKPGPNNGSLRPKLW